MRELAPSGLARWSQQRATWPAETWMGIASSVFLNAMAIWLFARNSDAQSTLHGMGSPMVVEIIRVSPQRHEAKVTNVSVEKGLSTPEVASTTTTPKRQSVAANENGSTQPVQQPERTPSSSAEPGAGKADAPVNRGGEGELIVELESDDWAVQRPTVDVGRNQSPMPAALPAAVPWARRRVMSALGDRRVSFRMRQVITGTVVLRGIAKELHLVPPGYTDDPCPDLKRTLEHDLHNAARLNVDQLEHDLGWYDRYCK